MGNQHARFWKLPNRLGVGGELRVDSIGGVEGGVERHDELICALFQGEEFHRAPTELPD
jgi:hypothetical protein